MDKQELRREMHRLRAACENRAKLDAALFQNIITSRLYQTAECILTYVSFGSEVDTRRLIQQALTDGKSVFVPRCSPNSGRMAFYRIDTPDALRPGAYGILEPPAKESRRFIEGEQAICFVPGLAFTESGVRLGYGKGYYDAFLSGLPICTVGLCYGFQIVHTIPAKAHDKPVLYICTERCLYSCADHSDTDRERKDFEA